MLSGTEIHQRGRRHEQDYHPSDESSKIHSKPNRGSPLTITGSSPLSFAAIGVVFFLFLIGIAFLLLSGDSRNEFELGKRIPVVAGRNAKKIMEDAMKKKSSSDEAAYAQKVRERYQSRMAKIREQELKNMATSEPSAADVAHETATSEVFQNAQPGAVPQQAPEAVSADAKNTLEESLQAIREQLAHLQQGLAQKETETQTTEPPSAAPAENAERDAEIQNLVAKMAELRAQSAALEAMIEQAKTKR